MTDAQWAADPMGRHEHRYWNGTEWTDQVSDRGVTAVDPLDSGAPAPPGARAATATYQAPVQVAHRRKKWPWILGGVLLVFVLGIGGCTALVVGGVNNAVNQLNAEQKAHAITEAQFQAVPIGSSQARVIASLGRHPENTQEFVSKGVLSASSIDSSCIYYNKAGSKFGSGDIYQFCFTNNALDTKNSL